MPDQFTEFLELFFSTFGTQTAYDTPETIVVFQSTVQWAAIVLSALAGVAEARRRELDLFGALVIAFVASVGGGTMRDLLLGRYPLFWVASPVYLVTVLVVSTIGVFIMAGVGKQLPIIGSLVNPVRRVMRSDETPGWVTMVDALGLGLWAYLGTAFALQSGAAPIVAPVFGVMTASFGGVIRDVFFAEVPSIFKRGQLYSTSAAIGSVVYVLLFANGVDTSISFVLCVSITFLVRMISVRFNIVSM